MAMHCCALILSFALSFSYVFADTPANCTYEDARGEWRFGLSVFKKDCKSSFQETSTVFVTLLYPNIAKDHFGNTGTWTLIYNQGFEVTLSHRKWLVKFDYDRATHKSFCGKGIPGWTHDTLIRQWFCFSAQKIGYTPSLNIVPIAADNQHLGNRLYQKNTDFISQINSVQYSWRARHYVEHEKYSLLDMYRRSGGKKSVLTNRPSAAPTTKALKELVNQLPKEFDWRSPPGGESVVTSVRDQLECGSCYAFASAAALESRIRILSNNTVQPILSPQDIIDCSNYSEGCDGGFPYLVAGKYSEDFGMVEEQCNEYKGEISGECMTPANCRRYYSTDYYYVGGYYGATNEDLMMLELVNKGPFPVSYQVYSDFSSYSSGIYHHTGIMDNLNRFDPFELVSHVVLLVGYGVEPSTGEKFWSLKNSWGSDWGEDGFFRIRRSTNECGIESIAVGFSSVL